MEQTTDRKGTWVVAVLAWAVLTWAVVPAGAWPVPDTGQEQSYADGDDGFYSINPRSYTDNGDGTVVDNVTKLVWQQQDDEQARNWEGANDYCEALTLSGFTDWRLPTVQELTSLVNFGASKPSIDQTAFPGTQPTWYWSSTTNASISANAWDVNFYSGAINYYDDKSVFNYVLCVRGATDSWSFGPLVINNSDTATDVGTGLSWQRQDDGQAKSWEEVLAYCEGLTLEGFEDWRLPTSNELLTLVDHNQWYPAIDVTVFTDVLPAKYWSSTSTAGNDADAWYVNFFSGYVSNHDKTDSNYVRCVRGGPVSWSFGSVVISSPPQAGNVTKGTTLAMAWAPKGLGGMVAISLSRQGGKDGTWETINAETKNDGAYNWKVNGSESVNCVLKIEPLLAPDLVGFQGLFSITQATTTTETSTTTTTLAPTTSTITTSPNTTTTTTMPGGESITLAVSAGWSLLSSAIGFPVATILGDTQQFTSAWAWVNGTWAVYLPGEATPGGYATSKGFSQLSVVAPGEGFWVNATAQSSVTVVGSAVNGAVTLSQGWNLVGLKSGKSSTVVDFIAAKAGIVSLWKWQQKTWAVYLPGDQDKGAAYAASKGFGQFTTIEPGEGFWVNMP
jgi:hypothetical protein